MTKYKKNGKKLGVLGGMGPAAAAEFLRQLAARCPAASDQEHPVVYMIGDCELPDRSTAIFGEGESPAALLEAHLNKLCELGADVLAVPCNTAHYFIDDFRERLPQPLVHIIEETVLAAQRLNPAEPGCFRPTEPVPAACTKSMLISTAILYFCRVTSRLKKRSRRFYM